MQWDGIKCDEHKRVTEIDRSGKGLQGNMSKLTDGGVPSIFTLPAITKIDLSANADTSTGCKGVYGSFPSDFNQASASLDTVQVRK